MHEKKDILEKWPDLYSALYSKCVLTSPNIIGYREKSILVWASNTKIPMTSEISTCPNVKLLAIG